jgi:hypothetical protein
MTGVKWLSKEYEKWSHEGHFIPKHLLEQALEIEKQNIIDSYNIGYNDAECNHINDGEQYYSQTFNHD